jgi:SOS-response transcriptional repressor LexA
MSKRSVDTPTARQAEYLSFIRTFTDRWGMPPSFEEIGRHFMTTAPSVNNMIKTLEARGFLTRVPGQARTLRVIMPERLIAATETPADRSTPRDTGTKAPKACEPARPNSARDELPKFALDEGRHAAGFVGRAQEGREVRADDLVQHGVFGRARAVGTDARGGTRRGHPPSCAEIAPTVDPYEYPVVARAVSTAGRVVDGRAAWCEPACLGSAGGVAAR